jgi:uncharacterized protein YdeI (YjbR/CyaY-like superfamily)
MSIFSQMCRPIRTGKKKNCKQISAHSIFGTQKVKRMTSKVATASPSGGGPAEEELRVPTDLRKALAADPAAQAKWRALTPIARRDFISWIGSARQLETRRRRIERAGSMLVAGKRRPCCYSIVSLDLHLALKATPKAKAQWSDLTSIERRDFITWMDSAKEKEAHKRRIEKACSMLAAGKRRP